MMNVGPRGIVTSIGSSQPVGWVGCALDRVVWAAGSNILIDACFLVGVHDILHLLPVWIDAHQQLRLGEVDHFSIRM